MIYLNHDIFSNFDNSVKSGDSDLTINILANEVSDFIVYDTKKMVELLTKADISANESMTDEALVDLLITNLPINKKLAKTVAFQIADSNGLINSKDDNKSKAELLAKIDIMAAGVVNIGNKLKDDKALSAKTKKDIMSQIETKAKAKGDYQRIIYSKKKISRKTIYWVLGIAAAGAVAYYIYYRHKKAKMLALGGGVPPVQSAPIFQAPQPAQVQAAPVQQAPPPPPPAPAMPQTFTNTNM